jgi:hypothetical protein
MEFLACATPLMGSLIGSESTGGGGGGGGAFGGRGGAAAAAEGGGGREGGGAGAGAGATAAAEGGGGGGLLRRIANAAEVWAAAEGGGGYNSAEHAAVHDWEARRTGSLSTGSPSTGVHDGVHGLHHDNAFITFAEDGVQRIPHSGALPHTTTAAAPSVSGGGRGGGGNGNDPQPHTSSAEAAEEDPTRRPSNTLPTRFPSDLVHPLALAQENHSRPSYGDASSLRSAGGIGGNNTDAGTSAGGGTGNNTDAGGVVSASPFSPGAFFGRENFTGTATATVTTAGDTPGGDTNVPEMTCDAAAAADDDDNGSLNDDGSNGGDGINGDDGESDSDSESESAAAAAAAAGSGRAVPHVDSP